MAPIVEIDEKSGFCFGVVTAINKAETELRTSGGLYCLGDIVHNSSEVERLEKEGLRTITHEELRGLSNAKVLLRAHGEPPTTYDIARKNNIEIIDATCPVVLKLQGRIKEMYRMSEDIQIVIYGQAGHAEVNGLVGQTEGNAIVVEDENDLAKVDMSRDVALYSQTTKSVEGFKQLIETLKTKMNDGTKLMTFDTICRSVAGRVDHLRKFASEHEVIVFVAGKKSSNGKILYNHCKEVNPQTFLVEDENGLKVEWISSAKSIGVCGATSTPRRLMEKVRDKIYSML